MNPSNHSNELDEIEPVFTSTNPVNSLNRLAQVEQGTRTSNRVFTRVYPDVFKFENIGKPCKLPSRRGWWFRGCQRHWISRCWLFLANVCSGVVISPEHCRIVLTGESLLIPRGASPKEGRNILTSKGSRALLQRLILEQGRGRRLPSADGCSMDSSVEVGIFLGRNARPFIPCFLLK